jgi:uncharacterized Zn ribbon protein
LFLDGYGTGNESASGRGFCCSGRLPNCRDTQPNLAYQGRNESDEGIDMTDVKDSNGTKLADGDSVTLIKDLKVKAHRSF